MPDGYRKLRVVDDQQDRWEVARGTTAAHSWIDLRQLEYDDDDMYTQTASMTIPDHVASQLIEAIGAVVDVPLVVDVTAGDLLPETIRLISLARRKDWLGFQHTLRDVHASREIVSIVIGQLVHLTLAALMEVVDDESVDEVLTRWLNESAGVDDDQLTDDQLSAFFNKAEPPSDADESGDDE